MNDLQILINNSVKKLLENSTSEEKIKHIFDKQKVKPHFIPIRYRVLGGLLQSMNIQFGNFIENLMTEIINEENRLEILSEYSGNKNKKYRISLKNEERIDNYITRCQSENLNLNTEFPNLLNEIINDTASEYNVIKHDVDMLFRDKTDNKIYYFEMKYNDDHDTGKFVDINRKFIKTYAYLVNEFNIKNLSDLTPYIFYFTPKRMKGNIYVPEETNILRGPAFFDRFLTIKYTEVEEALENFSENTKNVQTFDELYHKIMHYGK